MLRIVTRTLCCMCLFLVADLQAADVEYWKVVNIREGRVLNVRTGPSQEFSVVGSLAFDAVKIKNNGCFPDFTPDEWQRLTQYEKSLASNLIWCRVAYDGFEGWASFRYLMEY